MGVDIHLHIVKDNKELAHEIYDGRNSDWFGNLTGRAISEPAYVELPYDYDWDNEEVKCPLELIERYNRKDKSLNCCPYYGHRHIKVGDFKGWYNEYKPSLKAGYVSRYDKWLWDTKHIQPNENNIEHYLWSHDEASSDHIVDWVWIEYGDKNEPSTWLMNYLIENETPDDAYLIYCFDC